MICPIVNLWSKGAQMDIWGMLTRHEIGRQARGREFVIWGFPAEITQV